ncbi:dCTP deaminase (plasmid) [Halorarum halophilum]|uniref:dCTP deaminase n=1 Tax=Halorarum halophilum TaxID=2743090 RepID=A0A7D5KIH9_9EURY|nr:dCTP deaminase [Halobaculum halophilum]QLG30036.1 dCTP deaminase [Halobaculum halophilum]
MILSDRDIKAEIERGNLVVTPLDDTDLQIQPASVDVRLGDEIIEFDDRDEPLNPHEVDPEDVTTRIPFETYVIEPGEFVLMTTYEYVGIPDELIGFVEGRSSWGRWGIKVHSTAGLIDPGYKGMVTLEVSNEGKIPIVLTAGDRIAQLTFQRLTSPCERPYGEERGSKYQNQAGPQVSRLDRENTATSD